MLKELQSSVSPVLADIFSLSLQVGITPSAWRKANVVPIYKKGPKSDPGNYRPVSLTSVVCKIMEVILRDSITEHLESNNLLSPHQHGFRKGRSCSTQLLGVMKDWCEALDSSDIVDCVYLDYRKAFDSVPHIRLLTKVHAYGIQGKVYDWIRAFLTQRTQRVLIDSAASTECVVTSGIPQGSVIGPLLFVIFINDLPEVVSDNSTVKLFADDTKLYSTRGLAKDNTGLQEDLYCISSWAEKWQLSFNEKKCKVMSIGRKNPHLRYKLKLDDISSIPEAEQEKDLGVMFDSRLQFSNHVDTVTAKANRLLGLLKRTFSNLEEKGLVQLYKSIIRPSLEYCTSVWHPYLKKDTSKLEKVQRRATKLIPSLRSLGYKDRLKKLKLPTLSYRRHRADMIQTFKIVYGLDNMGSSDFLLYHEDSRTRGHMKKLRKLHSNTRFQQKEFTQRVINLWNNLPSDVVYSTSVNSFKSNLEKAWASKFDCYDPDEDFA